MFELMCLTSALWTSDAMACPICTGGYTEYYEWVCDRTHERWVQEVVGFGTFGGPCGSHFTMQWGETSDCWLTVQDVGGGTEEADCVDAECPPPPNEVCSTSRIPPR